MSPKLDQVALRIESFKPHVSYGATQPPGSNLIESSDPDARLQLASHL
jgi:hypothetical protein